MIPEPELLDDKGKEEKLHFVLEIQDSVMGNNTEVLNKENENGKSISECSS